MNSHDRKDATEQRPVASARARMWPLTAVLVVGWLGLMSILLVPSWPGVDAPAVLRALPSVVFELGLIFVIPAPTGAVLLGLVVVLPILTGAVIAGWRERRDDSTLHRAILGGAAMNGLTVLVMAGVDVAMFLRAELQGPPQMSLSVRAEIYGYFFDVLVVGGGLLGALGCGLWGLLARRPALRLHPR